MSKPEFIKKSFPLVSFAIGGAVYSILPAGFMALFVLGMQDSSASEEDIFRLKIYVAIIFLIGGIIGSLVTFFRTGIKRSAVIGGLLPSILILGFFIFEAEKFQAGMILVYLFYVLPGCATGLVCGFIPKKIDTLSDFKLK